MRPSLILLAGVALAAAGCASAPPTASPLSAAPAPIAGYDWFLSEDADQDAARLAYGVAESDELRLGLDCRRGSGRLELTALASDGAPHEILVESGGDTERLRAAAEPDLIHDGLILTAAAPADLPVFRRFRSLGWIALWRDGDDRQAYAPHPGSTDRIERFFAFCG